MGRAPKRKRSYSNHPFSGVNSLLVSGRVTKHDTLPTVVNCRWHMNGICSSVWTNSCPGWRFSWRQLWYCVQSPSKPVCMRVGSTKSGRCWQTDPHSLMDKWLHQLTNLTWQCFNMWGAVKIYYNCLVCFWRVIVFWGGPYRFTGFCCFRHHPSRS